MRDLRLSICLGLMAFLFAFPLGALSDSPDQTSGQLTPAQQQALWMTGAYLFLNDGYYYPYSYSGYYPYYYPYNSPIYNTPSMPYPKQPYYPYYAPYTYYAPYPSYNAPSQEYAAPVQVGAPTQTSPPTQTPPSTQTYPAAAEYTIMTNVNSSLGTYLIDGKGMTLYHLLSDQGSYSSKCTDATCTGSWPPFYAGSIIVPGNLNPADFSIITVNGYRQYQQTAFRGWPLFYFYGDTKPGDISGQGIEDNYGIWSAVIPDSSSTFPADFVYQSDGAATP